ncbi:AraC family transcriptional regulator with amidase-like domain [Phyllobacterium myrsinacearum]|uniref:GlxA family transcriptional regulator n=1 Tax=Phyllobacterium myrsinacearum TaxID=28101 RepID=UPI001029BBE9|nr:helix-turn-helix domain-containing protein [Phyllobacterium myrsinacearum]RZS83079.1 AraC family transcriptional regulator with amidase-like domain [Phyllobacterium myrsinacearum]
MTLEERRHIDVLVVVPARALLLDIAGPVEVLRKANLEQDAVHFGVRYVGPLASVTTSIGLTISGIEPLPHHVPDDAMIMLAGDTTILMDTAASRGAEAHGHRDREIVAWLKAHVGESQTLVTICSGALLAARAGLLDACSCTTHFASVDDLRALAPTARVLDNRLYVEDGNRFSSAGITAGIDLMLHLVSRMAGPACAVAVARYLVVYLRRSGTDPQWSPWLDGRNHIHPAIHRVQDRLAADPAQRWTLESLADIAATSPRHLSRLFNEHAGMSIPDYLNRLRVALAQEILSHTRLDMEGVAERTGFASARQLRRAWGRIHTTPPSGARGMP